MRRIQLLAIVLLLAAVVLSRPTTVGATPAGSNGTCGDLNHDGDFNISDVITQLQIISDIEAASDDQVINGDLDRDGNIDIIDVIASLKLVVGGLQVDACGPERNRVVFVPGICSEPLLEVPIGEGDRNLEASEGGAGVPEHNFRQIREWLIDELGYHDKPDRADGSVDPEDEIVYFSYAPDNVLPYSNTHTRDSIDFVEGLPSSGLRLREFIQTKAMQPGRKVDLIGHSQGGVISLWAALDGETAAHVNGIVTLESPVRGISGSLVTLLGLEDFLNLIGFESFCGDRDTPSVLDMRVDVPEISNVIMSIGQRTWKASPGPYVVNVSSIPDPIVGSLDLFFTEQELKELTATQLALIGFCCGEQGLLDPEHLEDSDIVHGQYLMDAGGGVSNGHQYPLDVTTNSAAMTVTRQAIVEALSSNRGK